MYDDEKFHDDQKTLFRATRRAIVQYLILSSRDKGDADSDGKAIRPAHAVKADELLKMLEEMDPETVAHVKRLLATAEE